ncbi:MAG: adenylate/guanylate cyclase domain-containing protein [Treponema sp.]|jgi:adenylate cyclase|nr:adenylate/guanylate cyclase domain-containing protein [Treponema sp.]
MSKALLSDTKTVLAVVFLTLLVSLALSLTPLFPFFDRFLYDSFLKIKVSRYPELLNPRIVPVDLNDSSENELRESINSRAAFADLLRVLGDYASSAVLDFVFKNPLGENGPSPAELDLIQAAAGMKSLVLAVIPIPEKLANYSYNDLDQQSREILKRNLWHIREMGANSIPTARSFILSFPAFSEKASQLGHIGVEHDKDGVYRKTPLFYRWEDGLIPSLALAAAVRELRVDPRSIEFYPGKVLILPRGPEDPPVRIPVDRSGYVRIPYTSHWTDNLYRISFAQAARARYDDDLFDRLFDELSGSICLAADTSTFKQDFGVTPVEAVFPRSGIYLAVMSGILNNSFYRDIHPAVKLTLGILILAAVLAAGLQKKDSLFNAGLLLITLASGGLCYTLWRCFSLIPFCGLLVFFISVSWLSLFILRQFSRYREQLLYKNALSRYFPQALAERICAEGRIDLAPAVKELSVLFADIVSFTKWSSDKTPDTVHAFLSDYLETMAAIIFEHGGTIDKFMGDGILAFFGDPFEQEDHAERAVRAAIVMQKKIALLREIWMPRTDINLMVRIGINTGTVIAGNLGSKTRIEYTVIGAAVNLGQRMESNAPPGGILVSAATRGAVRGPVRFGNQRFVTVKGYDAPIECFEALF